jgi:hypothetical protein
MTLFQFTILFYEFRVGPFLSKNKTVELLVKLQLQHSFVLI